MTIYYNRTVAFPNSMRPEAEISRCAWVGIDDCTNTRLLREGIEKFRGPHPPMLLSEFFNEIATEPSQSSVAGIQIVEMMVKWWLLAWSPNGNSTSCERCLSLLSRLWHSDNLMRHQPLLPFEMYTYCDERARQHVAKALYRDGSPIGEVITYEMSHRFSQAFQLLDRSNFPRGG